MLRAFSLLLFSLFLSLFQRGNIVVSVVDNQGDLLLHGIDTYCYLSLVDAMVIDQIRLACLHTAPPSGGGPMRVLFLIHARINSLRHEPDVVDGTEKGMRRAF